MKAYKVAITKTIKARDIIAVEAETAEEAVRLARKKWQFDPEAAYVTRAVAQWVEVGGGQGGEGPIEIDLVVNLRETPLVPTEVKDDE